MSQCSAVQYFSKNMTHIMPNNKRNTQRTFDEFGVICVISMSDFRKIFTQVGLPQVKISFSCFTRRKITFHITPNSATFLSFILFTNILMSDTKCSLNVDIFTVVKIPICYV